MYFPNLSRCLAVVAGMILLSACQTEFKVEPASLPVLTLPEDAPAIVVQGNEKFDRTIKASTLMCSLAQLHIQFSKYAEGKIAQELAQVETLQSANVQIDEVMMRVMYHTTDLSELRRAMEVRIGLSADYVTNSVNNGKANVVLQDLYLGEIEKGMTDCRPDEQFAAKVLPDVIAAVSGKLVTEIRNAPPLTN